ncbi:MAG: helicase, partial [Hyphomicrobiaceae bacterium]|nr:helicase [Hyphomicrobiaceae bacterium]
MPAFSPATANVRAVLGPTNTGKTHFAVERMLAHRTGMIGLPLRLLAREVYQRVAGQIGPQAVALVTGEERIVPATARYWVATVEAMPLSVPVDFMAVDEIQTATDLTRGHVFTDRILNARGAHETLLLGAATMAPVLRTLMPGIEIIERPRLSNLFYAGSKKITRQPQRSAIVAFSQNEVYAIAELVRRERGGAAVVMGALSPRTRNAQVELYQNGDVDFLVATDAIGMGLNLDVHHVAFSDNVKFDGRTHRHLTPAELGQIAGRAGRHKTDGTFGVTGHCDPFDDETVDRLQTHDFEAVRVIQWRNSSLDFASPDALLDSLNVTPDIEKLTRIPAVIDQTTLEALMRGGEARRARTRAEVELLWQCCQIPDYRDISPALHADLIKAIFSDILGGGKISQDWIAEQVRFCDNVNGDIDTLSNRIRQIRTWTFVANKKDWLDDPNHWREKTSDIENRLSDALHERLVQRFVDRRTSVLLRHLRDRSMVDPEINESGEVSLEGHLIGSIEGFRF